MCVWCMIFQSSDLRLRPHHTHTHTLNETPQKSDITKEDGEILNKSRALDIMSLTPRLCTRGLWVKAAAEQLEKDNERCRKQLPVWLLHNTHIHSGGFSENEMFNRDSRSKHLITRLAVPKRPRFTPAREEVKGCDPSLVG